MITQAVVQNCKYKNNSPYHNTGRSKCVIYADSGYRCDNRGSGSFFHNQYFKLGSLPGHSAPARFFVPAGTRNLQEPATAIEVWVWV